MSQTLIIASSNAHKIQELGQMLQQAGIELEVVAMQRLGQPPEIEETAPDFAGNATLKSEGIAQWALGQNPELAGHAWVLADDSGLCVDALDGAPGVLSARFSGPQANDASNNAKLVAELKGRGLEVSPAHFCCALALTSISKDGSLRTHRFEGQARGQARVQPAGDGGFGYDPHVWIDGQTQSFAQMPGDVKARISHRGNALKALLSALPELLNQGQQ